MKVPVSWLSDFVDLEEEALLKAAGQISLKAFEVEGISTVGTALEGPLTIGEILEITRHPKADKLQVTQTRISQDQVVQIVCGAPNIAVGQRVPVALPGSKVISRKTGEPLSIGLGQIRDISSAGMLCSASELGLEGDEGIRILPENAPIGEDLLSYLNLKPAAVLEIASRSNRGDALSMQGMAREIAAVLGAKLKLDYYALNLPEKLKSLTANLPSIPASTPDSKACVAIGFLRLDGIRIGASPKWLSERLTQSGIKSINNIVDITNYVMLELGQPMHAYDANKVDQPFQVGQAHSGQSFVALDSKTYTLTEECLIIGQEDQVLALAGVMGGNLTSISDQTVSIVFEAGCFQSQNVRRTSRLTGISTESSRRFERGTDPHLIPMALYRAAELAKSLAGGQISAFGLHGELYTGARMIEWDLEEFERILGYRPFITEAVDILLSIGIKTTQLSDSRLYSTIPSYRTDICRSIDLIEEVARLLGFERIIGTPLPPTDRIWEIDRTMPRLANALTQAGYHEIMSSSLRPESQSEAAVQMLNPLSREHAELRQSLIPGLLEAANYNFRRQTAGEIRLFELGRAYMRRPDQPTTLKSTATKESPLLGIILSVSEVEQSWQANIGVTGFYELKGVLEELDYAFSFQKSLPEGDLWHPEIYTKITTPNGSIVGELGKLHPLAARHHALPEETFLAQLELAELPSYACQEFRLSPLPDTQILWRDFTIDLANYPESPTHAEILALIDQSKLSHLHQVKLVSLFQKDSAKGDASLTYRLGFQSDEVQLTGEQINQMIDRLKSQITARHQNASFRA